MANNYFLLIIFLIVALPVLFGSHFLVYYSVVNFFKVVSSNAKFILAAVLCFLPLSFFLSSYLAHFSESFLNRMLYFATGLWFGVLTELVVAFALGWLAVGIIRISGNVPETRTIGMLVFAVAFLMTGYGVWNAYHPRVTQITVKIDNLPEAWKGKTAVQISDVHLGHILRENFLSGIVGKINSQHPDIVFITGDLFDGMDGDLSGAAEPLELLKPRNGTYFVTGNHETYLGVQKVFTAVAGTGVNILDDKMAVVDGVQIAGISYPERGKSKNIEETLKNMPGFNPVVPSILLFHSPTQMDRAKKEGIDLQLSGHTHVGQIFPLRLVTWLIWKKYDYGFHVDGNFSIYTSSGVGVWGPTMRTGNMPEIVVIKFQ